VRVALISYPGEWRAGAQAARPASFWAGDYAGVVAGGLFARPKTSFGGASTSNAVNGAEYGFFAGHNFMFGSWMLGFEGATLLTDAHGTGPQPGIANVSFEDFFETDLRGRAGYAFGRFLPYITVGAAWSRSQQVDLATLSQRGNIFSEAVATGGGVEYAIDDRWAANLEYLHDTPFSHTSTGLDGVALAQKRSADEVRVGLAYYFH
jgi:opacity protein-like surface antigen